MFQVQLGSLGSFGRFEGGFGRFLGGFRGFQGGFGRFLRLEVASGGFSGGF